MFERRGSPYYSLYHRLSSTIHEPENEQACWIGNGRKVCRFGYHRINVWVPGLGKTVQMSAHVALWVALQWGVSSPDEIYLAYLEFRYSGLTLDHTCVRPACRNPDHLKPVTMTVNNQLAALRRKSRSKLGVMEC
jgi:hypothetical protein